MGSQIPGEAGQFGAVQKFLRDKFGGACRDEEFEVSVTQAPVQLVPFDFERVVLIVINNSSEPKHIATTSAVNGTLAAPYGIRLAPNGGLIAFNVDEDAILPALRWWASAETLTQDLLVITVRRETVPKG